MCLHSNLAQEPTSENFAHPRRRECLWADTVGEQPDRAGVATAVPRREESNREDRRPLNDSACHFHGQCRLSRRHVCNNFSHFVQRHKPPRHQAMRVRRQRLSSRSLCGSGPAAPPTWQRSRHLGGDMPFSFLSEDICA